MSHLSTEGFDEFRFKQQVETALKKVRNILDNTRNPQYPSDVPHRYEDKYHLAEFLTNTAVAAVWNSLEAIGLDEEKFKTLVTWSNTQSVTIRLSASETCTFNRKSERKVQDATEYVTEIKGPLGGKATITDKSFTLVKEWFWDFSANYEISAYKGTLKNNPNDKVVLQNRKGDYTIMTTSEFNPRSSGTSITPLEFNITWLLKYIKETNLVNFTINRNSSNCRTPRRNIEISEALSFFVNFNSWTLSFMHYFNNTLFPVQKNHGLDLSKIQDTDIFIPVVPLFEDSNTLSDTSTRTITSLISFPPALGNVVSRVSDVNLYLAEEKRSIAEKFKEMETMFTDTKQLITAAEAKILVVFLHLGKIATHYVDGINYIENMLYKQLIAAIGKEVSAADFLNYMKFHNRQIFRQEFEPKPFSFAVRRPEHYPEGTVSLEQTLSDGSISEPVYTSVRSAPAIRPLHFLLNAAAKVSFLGQRHLHAWVPTQFARVSGSSISLVSRARQFSSFIVLIGAVVSAELFEPTYAMIVQNKDEIKIPVEMSRIPTQAKFEQAIESLSPEQQRFARAYRSMQLGSSLFGVCIIQIKPQLEKLLNLPEDSLTKEIKLTQDLMELFLKYQIPSDLISFAGSPNTGNTEKVNAVKRHVLAMQDMIKASRAKELEEQRQVTQFAVLDAGTSSTYCGGAFRLIVPITICPRPPRSVQIGSAASFYDPSENYEKAAGEENYLDLSDALDRKFEILDADNALCPTSLALGTTWTKRSQKALLASPSDEVLTNSHHISEKNRAFDLLEVLSRSGALSCDYTDFHVIMAATHSFEHSLIDTVLKDNINPIEKVERSTLIVATTVQNRPAIELVKPEHVERVSTYSPALFAPVPRRTINN